MNGQRLIIILVLVLTFLCSTVLIGAYGIDVAAKHAARPPSATDIVMQSRQTAAVTAGASRAWLGAGLLALFLVGAGAAVFLMKGGSDLLKQWRLARKKPRRRPVQPIPHTPYAQGGYVADVPRIRQARQLEVTGDEQADFDSYPY